MTYKGTPKKTKEENKPMISINPTVENMKELLIGDKTYQWYGIRGVNEPLKMGEVLDTSYQWDWEYDRSTYGEENEEDLGGVSTIDATTDDYLWHKDEDTLNKQAEFMAERAKWHKEQYKLYKYYYIVGSNNRNPKNYEENDEHEAILANAVVLAELNHNVAIDDEKVEEYIKAEKTQRIYY